MRYLNEICVERGVFLKEDSLQKSEARLIVSGNRGIITVQPDETYPARTRFSIAHELGHFELHRKWGAFWNCGAQEMTLTRTIPHREDREGIEQEANEFASELLMPEDFIRTKFLATPPSLIRLKELQDSIKLLFPQ